jgi:hypothetical protein
MLYDIENTREISFQPHECIDEFSKDVRTCPQLIKRVKEKWKDL